MNQSIYASGKYLANNPTWHEGDSKWKANQIYSVLSNNKYSPKSIAEIGCGAGEIIACLSNYYPDIILDGYEISSVAFEICKKKQSEHLTYFNMDFIDTNKTYDCLLMIDVVEHIHDYFLFLSNIRSKANRFVFHIPLDFNAQMVIRGTPLDRVRSEVGHVHYFTKDIFLSVLSEANYNIISWNYTGSSLCLESASTKAKLMRPIRKLLYKIAPDFCVRLLGGFSLIVLAESK